MKTKIYINYFAILFSILFIVYPRNLKAQDTRQLLDLEGNWKFKLGDEQRWADPKFNDGKWSEIYVPANWEDEGYPGYDGYAWYRIHFNVEKEWLSRDLLLDLGLIDDADETYVNGQFIDFSGLFPPNYFSTYNVPCKYPIPAGILHAGKDNVIAVRVYDGGGYGGINHGPIGLYERRNFLHPDLALPTTWKYTTGDDMNWKEVNFDDKNWKSVRVPAYWETQGFKNYDGFGWYRVAFTVPEEYLDKDVIMLVGKVDDFDETYLNGEKIGRTGEKLTEGFEMHYTNSDSYLQSRAYTIPAGLLKAGKENILAVRVYDCWLGGGIYDGPIGIITREHYLDYKHSLREPHRWFKELMEDLFK